MKITAAQMIRSYRAPQWLVEPHPDADPYDPETLAALNAIEVQVLDRSVLGWPPYNAIIRYTDGAGTTDYLAHIEYTRKDAQARVDATSELDAHSETILYDWYEEDHWEWVCTAPIAEIVDWAETVERTAES